MFRVSNFAKLAASAKAAMTSRDAASTQENLENINKAVEKLKTTVQAYKGGLLAASSISSDQAALGQDIKYAIADVKKSEVVTVEEAQKIIAYIKDVLEPTIAACMDAVKEKKGELATAGLQGTVQGDMADLRALTNDLGKELVAKAPAAEQPNGKVVLDKIDARFEDAVTYFK